MKDDIPIITIDGTSGAGKGTIARLLAEKLGWHFLDSGALYRVLALIIIRSKISLDNISSVVDTGQDLTVQFIMQAGAAPKIMLATEDVTAAIRHEECGNVASKIASIIEVRSVLIAKQRSFCQPPGLVADGRDMGTVVFPQAKFKFFLIATLEERAKRRLFQLQDQGISATLDIVLRDLARRDQRDSERAIAPLKPDPAAMIIDTTKLSIDEVLQQILAHVTSM